MVPIGDSVNPTSVIDMPHGFSCMKCHTMIEPHEERGDYMHATDAQAIQNPVKHESVGKGSPKIHRRKRRHA